jgi:hypothetical protein
MGEINIPPEGKDALKKIDDKELSRLIDKALCEERTDVLYGLPLASCGPYVAGRLRTFERSLVDYRQAKSARKRAETEERARRAGNDLSAAVSSMKNRMEEEEKASQLFNVDDLIMPPSSFTERLAVRVNYRWRRTVEDEWNFGTITFYHDVDLRPDYTIPIPKRKPGAVQQKREMQEKLYQTWEHLMRGALYSVRDYLKDGGDGSAIPETFKVTVDSHTRGLNNRSTEFWRQQS